MEEYTGGVEIKLKVRLGYMDRWRWVVEWFQLDKESEENDFKRYPSIIAGNSIETNQNKFQYFQTIIWLVDKYAMSYILKVWKWVNR